jgi:multicomponent Na+:H+ antiporter subunit C
MIWFLSITIGVLVTAGAYLAMQRRLIQMVLGFSLLSHATNLMIVASGWVGDGFSPILRSYKAPDPAAYVDPLPQAMVLTAIVISFAVTAFLLVIALMAYRSFETDDIDEMRRLKG